jgi:hypothetical protein
MSHGPAGCIVRNTGVEPVPCGSGKNTRWVAGSAATVRVDTDTSPFGGEHTAFIGNHIRDVLGLSGKKTTMPSDMPGSVKGDDPAVIKAWATRGIARKRPRALAARRGSGHGLRRARQSRNS